MIFHKYKKIHTMGHKENEMILSNPDDEIIVEEKIDGANFRAIHDRELGRIYGSRTQTVGEGGQNKEKTWDRAIEWLNKTDLESFPNHIFYFEYCIPHTMQYNWAEIPILIGLDILTPEETFIGYDDKVMIFNLLGIPYAPLIFKGSSEHFVMMSEADIPTSRYCGLQAEGIVIKNYNQQAMAKFVRSQFKEDNSKVFGKPKAAVSNDTERLISSYCTNPRIDKKIYELVDSGNELDMPLMQWLPALVWSDIVEEHGTDILNSNWNLNLRDAKKQSAGRCVEVLKQRVMERALHAQREGVTI